MKSRAMGALAKNLDEAVDGEALRSMIGRLVKTGRLYDLSHEISPAIPVHPFHHRYSLVLHRRHGDTPRPGGASFANEVMITTAHIGTHIDALGHFSRRGVLHGGIAVAAVETELGLRSLDAAGIPPLLRRGVLLDVAGLRGVESMGPGEAVGSEDLARCADHEGIAIEADDAVLVRTGWGRHWSNPEAFASGSGGCPGVSADGAAWLVQREAGIVGADTAGLEVSPAGDESVHALLLVEAGIPIIENLNLEEVAASRVYEFLLVALPLRLVGATASPIRPIALT